MAQKLGLRQSYGPLNRGIWEFFLIFEIKCIYLHLNLERKLNDID